MTKQVKVDSTLLRLVIATAFVTGFGAGVFTMGLITWVAFWIIGGVS